MFEKLWSNFQSWDHGLKGNMRVTELTFRHCKIEIIYQATTELLPVRFTTMLGLVSREWSTATSEGKIRKSTGAEKLRQIADSLQ